MTNTNKVLNRLLDFENSELLNTADKIIKTGNKIIDKVDEIHHIEPMSIEQFLIKTSPKIDKEIIHHANSNHLTPIGREIKFSTQNNDKILVVWEFYFTDKDSKYSKIGGEKTINTLLLTIEANHQIKANDLVFNINPPTLA